MHTIIVTASEMQKNFMKYAKLYYLTDGVIYYVKRKAEQPVHAGI